MLKRTCTNVSSVGNDSSPNGPRTVIDRCARRSPRERLPLSGPDVLTDGGPETRRGDGKQLRSPPELPRLLLRVRPNRTSDTVETDDSTPIAPRVRFRFTHRCASTRDVTRRGDAGGRFQTVRRSNHRWDRHRRPPLMAVVARVCPQIEHRSEAGSRRDIPGVEPGGIGSFWPTDQRSRVSSVFSRRTRRASRGVPPENVP